MTRSRRPRDLVVYWDAAGPVAVDLDSGKRRRVSALSLSALGRRRASPGGRLGAFHGNVASALYAAVTRDMPYLQDPAAVERYLREEVLTHRRPPLFKRLRGPLCPLEPSVPEGDGAALGRLLIARRTTREFSRLPVSFDDLSAIVRATWGQIGWFEGGPLGRVLVKTSPSAGAMHPMECYVLAWNVRGLPKGLWHYDVRADALRLLKRGDFRRQGVRIASGQKWVGKAAFLCVMTAVFGRTLWKYQYENFYRSIWIEAGHVGQTFALVATGRGLGPFQTAAIQDSYIEKLIGLDGVKEFPVYLCGAGVPRGPAGPAETVRARST